MAPLAFLFRIAAKLLVFESSVEPCSAAWALSYAVNSRFLDEYQKRHCGLLLGGSWLEK